MHKLREGDRVRIVHPTTSEAKDRCEYLGYPDWYKVPNGSIGTVINCWTNVCSIAFDKPFNGGYTIKVKDTRYENTWNVAANILELAERVSLEDLIIKKIKYLDKRYQDKQHAKGNV